MGRAEAMFPFQPEAHGRARGGAPSAAGTLIGGGLADGLDHEDVEASPGFEAIDPRQAGIDDVPYAFDGDRGFGDVGGDDHLSVGMGCEGFILLARGQLGVEREECQGVLGSAQALASFESAANLIGRRA